MFRNMSRYNNSWSWFNSQQREIRASLWEELHAVSGGDRKRPRSVSSKIHAVGLLASN